MESASAVMIDLDHVSWMGFDPSELSSWSDEDFLGRAGIQDNERRHLAVLSSSTSGFSAYS
jgi:hypothetical protein